MSQADSFESICQVFRDLFVSDYEKINAVFRDIPGIRKSQAKIHIEREGWTIIGFPIFRGGNDGVWNFQLRNDNPIPYSFKANFKVDGEVVLRKFGGWDGVWYPEPKT